MVSVRHLFWCKLEFSLHDYYYPPWHTVCIQYTKHSSPKFTLDLISISFLILFQRHCFVVFSPFRKFSLDGDINKWHCRAVCSRTLSLEGSSTRECIFMVIYRRPVTFKSVAKHLAIVGVLQLWIDTRMNFQTLSTMVDMSDCLQQLTKQDNYHSFKEKLVKWRFL